MPTVPCSVCCTALWGTAAFQNYTSELIHNAVPSADIVLHVCLAFHLQPYINHKPIQEMHFSKDTAKTQFQSGETNKTRGKIELDYIHCEKTDFGNGKDVDQQKCLDRLGASNLKKTSPPETWHCCCWWWWGMECDDFLQGDFRLEGLIEDGQGLMWWSVGGGLQTSAERQQREREHYSLLLEEGDSGRLWFLEEQNNQVKQRNCLWRPGHVEANCLNFWACEGRQPSPQHAGYQRSSHSYPFPQDFVTN